MKDFLWQELSVWDTVAYITTNNKQSLQKWVIYSMGEKRLHVHKWDTPYEQLIKVERSKLWNLEFKWAEQIIKY